MTRPIAVLVTGEPVPQAHERRGSFVDLIRQAASGFETGPWVAHDVRGAAPLRGLDEALAVIITGSPLSVTEALPWKDHVCEQLRELVRQDVPVLGICFGHQLLGHALGGRVSSNPNGREIGTVPLHLEEPDEVFGAQGRVLVNTTHVDSVVELPPGARVIGRTEQEPNAAVRFAPSAWGVQFHPELDAEVMRLYLVARRATLLAEGIDVDARERAVEDAPHGSRLIERFLQLARARRG